MARGYRSKHARRDEKQVRADYSPRHVSDSRTDTNRALIKKDSIKVIKYAIQFILVALLIYVVVRQVFFSPHYQAYSQASTDITATESNVDTPAFVAISYFGVEKFESDSATLISQERLNEHLEAL